MSTLEFLTNRQSNGLLQSPAPSQDQLQQIMQAAMAVPDHGLLTPYKFTVISGEGLVKLTDILVTATKATTIDDFKIKKSEKMAFRAPMIIVVATDYKEHPKVPKSEQFLTAGCAVYAMQMASIALGYQAMWRSGTLCFDPYVKSELDVNSDNDIVGFLYIGTEKKVLANKKRKDPDDFVSYWS